MPQDLARRALKANETIYQLPPHRIRSSLGVRRPVIKFIIHYKFCEKNSIARRFEADIGLRIDDLKKHISRIDGIPAACQVIIWNGNVLSDGKSLGEQLEPQGYFEFPMVMILTTPPARL